MSSRLVKISKIVLLICAIIMGLFYTAVQLSSPWMEHYRTSIEHYASEQLKSPVKINHIQLGWYYVEPVIRLTDVSVEDNTGNTFVSIGKIGLGINWLSSLLHWKLEPGVLVVSDVNAHLDPPVLDSFASVSKNTSNPLEEILPVVFLYKKVMLSNINVQWNNNNNAQYFPSFAVSNAVVKLKRKINGHYRLKLDLDWQDNLDAPKEPSHIFAAINFSSDMSNRRQLVEDVYLETKNIDFQDIQKRLKFFWHADALSALTIKQGKGDLQFEGTFDDHTMNTGNVHINSQNFIINYPHFFNHDVPFSDSDIQFQWQKTDSQWKLHTENFFLENPQLSLNATCSAEWKEGLSDATIQLNMPFIIHNLPKIRPYLPDNVMNPKLAAWLHRSIVGGKITTGNMILQGKLTDFPFDPPNNSHGLFLVDSNFQNFTLDFKEGWPAGKQMNAHIIFRNRDLIADIHDGTIDQLPLTQVKAQILGLGLGTETLKIQGHLQSDASKARNFVLHSPLIAHLSSFKNMALAGPGIFDIDIAIPLYPENNTNLVKGKAVFLNNTLTLKKWWNLRVEHVKGQLTYNQDGVTNSHLNGTLFGYPLQLNMKSVKKPIPSTLVDVKGTLSIHALHKIFPLFIFDFMQGTTSYTANLILTASKKLDDQLLLKSDLKGIILDLPKPFKKKATEKRPLSLQLTFSDNEASPSDTQLMIDYDNWMSLYLGYQSVSQKGSKNYSFHRGNIMLGGKKATTPQADGLVIVGSLPEFSLKAWTPFFNAMQATKKTDNNQKSQIQSVQLSTPLLITSHQDFHHTDLVLSPKNNFWMLHIKSDEMLGDIQLPSSANSEISARLDYIYLNSSDDNKKKQDPSSLSPMDIPPLNIQVKHFQYQQMDLGKIQLTTEQNKENDALVIKKLVFNAPSTSARFQGVWKKEKGQSLTQLRGTVLSTSIQQTLKNFGTEPVIQGNKGELNMDLHWNDTPVALHPSMLNGSASLTLNKGVITHLSKSVQDKIGVGKLLSLFSLQSLPQHLTLDFSDLSAKGLSFTVLKGNFVLRQGEMRTNDTMLEGPVADIAMKGAINMRNKTYNVFLDITPAVSSGIPVIATIAGGPVVGLAALAATTLIHQGMKRTSIYHYKVTGPWSNPTVKSY